MESSVTDERVIHGSALVFEDFTGGEGALRVRPYEDSLLRVISGRIRLTTDDSERVLGPGEEAVVPAGRCYRLSSLSGPGRTVTGFRSPRRERDDRITWL